ncbi:DUF6407 family protein [Halalkalibacter okhensis]|uniref:Uncharacterized protein n=1 Tax=Halalkalibacter okhensis TaxID=333138 RepID=A0A0B0IKL8_9BACI|nr:DUF6407 family protein [Halalkalibacter okhensis]KHF40614.1 hypothetical protein LQ50_08855 [Halalkalibacter okhensis]
MNKRKSFKEFAEEVIQARGHFDASNHYHLRDIVHKAIDYYQLKSFVQVEIIGNRRIETLHLASIVEENMLLRLAEITGNMDECSLEVIYDSCVVRKH